MVLLSIVIPAYNESKDISDTIHSIFNAIEQSNWRPYELIVVDDASTDGTAEIAQELGAQVVVSGKRNIAASRNAGAAVAQGEYLLFVDADTTINADLLNEMESALQDGAIGGGAQVAWSEPSGSRLADRVLALWNWISRTFHSPAGSFFFVKREAFEKVNGFDEEYFVTEELHLGKKLKKIGRLAILCGAVATSPRKLHQFSMREHIHLLGQVIFKRGKTFRNRKYLDIWYTRRD